MKILALHATINTGTKKDATGAFVPEAKAFAKLRRAAGDDVVLLGFDNSIANKAKRRAAVLSLVASESVDALAYFGHGLRSGLSSAAIDLKSVDELVAAVRFRTKRNIKVALYACSSGASPLPESQGPGGDGGFADVLRDRLSVAGYTGWVDAHTTPGHTTRNPHVRRFYMDGAAVGTGGGFIVTPGGPVWKRWVKALAKDLRFEFPFKTEDEIYASLGAS